MDTKIRNMNIVNSTKKQLETSRTIKAAILVVLGTIIYSLSIVWLFGLANLTSSGFTGLSQIICSYVDGIFGYKLPLAIPYIIFNIPLVIIGWKYVSKRFLWLSVLSVVLQFVILLIFENLDFNPFKMLEEERFVLTLLAGSFAGVGAGICLKVGGSSGGTDIIANVFVIRKNASFTKYSFLMDGLIIIACGITFKDGFRFDFETSVYTLIRLIFYLISLGFVYDIYHLIDIRIITSKPEELKKMLIEKIFHGFTVYSAKGGFTDEGKVVFEIIASRYELQDYIDIAKYIDDHAFVIATPVKAIHGNYIKKTIV